MFNHEKSKKHREMVAILRAHLEEEDILDGKSREEDEEEDCETEQKQIVIDGEEEKKTEIKSNHMKEGTEELDSFLSKEFEEDTKDEDVTRSR